MVMGLSTQTQTLAPGLACTPQVCPSGMGRAGRGVGLWGGLVSLTRSCSHRLPQLPLLRTIRGPGPRDRHPHCPGAHQCCVSRRPGFGLGQPGSASCLCDQGLTGPQLEWECVLISARIEGAAVWDVPGGAPCTACCSVHRREVFLLGEGRPGTLGG